MSERGGKTGKLKHAVKLYMMDKFGQEWAALDTSEVSLKLGTHELFNIVESTPQGLKRITITAVVEKYPTDQRVRRLT